jgi:hypothetical protein
MPALQGLLLMVYLQLAFPIIAMKPKSRQSLRVRSEMQKLTLIIRSLISIVIGMLAALILFGLSLALLWSFSPNDDLRNKLVTTLFSAVLSVGFGGLAASLIPGRKPVLHSLIFGLVFGLISTAYILAASWLVPLLVLTFGLAASAGGMLGKRLFKIGRENIQMQQL